MYQDSQFHALLENAFDQPLEKREAFVSAHGGDPSTAREVLESLAEMDSLGSFLEQPAVTTLTMVGR